MTAAAAVVVALVLALGATTRAALRAVGRDRAVDRLGSWPARREADSGPWWAAQLAAVGDRVGRRRAELRYEDALPEAVDHLAAAVRAGASTVQALTSTADRVDPPLADDLQAVVVSVARGAPLAAALERWCDARPLHAVQLAAAALDLGSRLGGRPATALDAVGDAVRERIGLRREVRALSAQARASAWVMTATPLAFAGAAVVLDPRVARVLLASPLGWACLACGLALDGASAAWMARIVRAAS